MENFEEKLKKTLERDKIRREELDGLLTEMEKQRNEEIQQLNRIQTLLAAVKQESEVSVIQPSCSQKINSECSNQSTVVSSDKLTEALNKISMVLESIVPEKNHNVRFEDIARSFKKFHGDSHLNIYSWLQHFNGQSAVFQLSPFEKLIYAKRLMDGNAKLFVELESKATNFEQLTAELIIEYGKSINSALTHQKLQARKKKNSETPIQYLYEMLSIASQSDIDIAAIVVESKAFMYEADNLADFKKKLLSYELLQTKPIESGSKITRDVCFNCGESGQHKSSQCPTRSEGPKCFKCKQNGLISSSCPSEPIRRMNIIQRVIEEEDDNIHNESPEETEKMFQNFYQRFK